MTINIRRSVAGISLATGLLTATLAGPAAAAPAAGSFNTRAPTPATHCVSAAVAPGSTPTNVAAGCFDTFAEAVSYATGGTVRLPAGAHTVSQQQLDAGRAKMSPRSPLVVIGVSYEDVGWTGNSWLHTAAFGCDTDPDVDWQNTGPLVGPGGGWDNEIGSALAFSDCTGTYWANAGFWGANINTDWSGGAMNNVTSAIQWF